MVCEWIDHHGKGLPVDADDLVRVRFRDGDERVGRAGFWYNDGSFDESNWFFSEVEPEVDIIAYRMVPQC